MQAPEEASEITPSGRARGERIFLKGREGRAGRLRHFSHCR
jgi:hypothetical protein